MQVLRFQGLLQDITAPVASGCHLSAKKAVPVPTIVETTKPGLTQHAAAASATIGFSYNVLKYCNNTTELLAAQPLKVC